MSFDTKVVYDFREFDKEPNENHKPANISVKIEKSTGKRAFSFEQELETPPKPTLKDRKVEKIEEEIVNKKSGEISFTYKAELPNKPTVNEANCNLSMTIVNQLPANNSKYKYMFDYYMDRAARVEKITNNTRQRLELSILEENVIETNEKDISVKLAITEKFQPFHLFHQEKIITIGKVAKEVNKDGVASYYLDGIHADQPVRTMLHLDSLRHVYSLFPGQVIAMKGSNPTSKLFRPVGIRSVCFFIILHHLYVNQNLTPYQPPVIQPYPITNDGFSVSIMVACGPYTTDQNLSYSPLTAIIKQATQLKPDILLLV